MNQNPISIILSPIIAFILGIFASDWFYQDDTIKLTIKQPSNSASNSRKITPEDIKNMDDTLVCVDKTKAILFDLPSIIADLHNYKSSHPEDNFDWNDVGFYATFASYPTDRGDWGDKSGHNTIIIRYVHHLNDKNPSTFSKLEDRNVGDMCPSRCKDPE